MKRIILIAFTFLILSCCAYSDWLPPENIGPPINTAYNEWSNAISLDGSYLIFTSDRPGGFGSYDLWISFETGGDWGEPQNMGPNINSSGTEVTPYLVENDTVLYFTSSAPGGYGNQDVYFCSISGGVAGPKTNIGPPVNTSGRQCCPVILSDGTKLYLGDTKSGGYGEMDIYVSEKVGGDWGGLSNMGGNINSSAYECPRWISDDGDTIAISSYRSGGYGATDIWYSVKSGGEWGSLTNMGSVINGPYLDFGPYFYDGGGVMGGIMYFCSDRAGGYGGGDIYISTEEGYIGIIENQSLGNIKAIYK